MRRVNYNYNAMKYFLNYLLLMFLLLCGGKRWHKSHKYVT